MVRGLYLEALCLTPSLNLPKNLVFPDRGWVGICGLIVGKRYLIPRPNLPNNPVSQDVEGAHAVSIT